VKKEQQGKSSPPDYAGGKSPCEKSMNQTGDKNKSCWISYF